MAAIARDTGSPRQAVLAPGRFELIYVRGAIFLMVHEWAVGEHVGVAAVAMDDNNARTDRQGHPGDLVMLENVIDVATAPAVRDGARLAVYPATHDGDGARPWWRRPLAMLTSSRRDPRARLAQHYSDEVRLARALVEDAESLTQYPQQRVQVLQAAEHAQRRAQRIQRTLEGVDLSGAGPVTLSREHTAWWRLRAHLSELNRMSEAYLADVYAVTRDSPEIADLLLQCHRESAKDRRDLVWTLARLGPPSGAHERARGMEPKAEGHGHE